MIDLTQLARARLHGGTRIHAVTPPGSRITACGKHIHLEVAGRRWDESRAHTEPVTCHPCRQATRSPA